MATHLFRPRYPEIARLGYPDMSDMQESFKISDGELSNHLPVHVLDVAFPEDKDERITLYGRDLMMEWGDSLVVKPLLIRNTSRGLETLLREAGYDKPMYVNGVLSEGGLFVAGKEFILISGSYKSQETALKQTFNELGIDAPLYFLQPSQQTTHIDCEYGISDSARVLYIANGLSRGRRTRLERIAKRHNFELREYNNGADFRSIEDSMNEAKLIIEQHIQDDLSYEKHTEIICRLCMEYPVVSDFLTGKNISRIFSSDKGINFIEADNTIYTSTMHEDERRFLEEKGVKVVVIPVGDLSPGAGLRCVYGQFTSSSIPLDSVSKSITQSP